MKDNLPWKMRSSLLLLLIGLSPLVSLAQPTSASSISFQGALNGANGQPLANGNYNLTFKFYTNAIASTALATSNVPNVPITNGLASTPIPVDAVWFDGQTRYLGIGVNNGQELSPRVLVTAVPYAMGFAGEQLKVGAATDFILPGYQLQIAGSRANILLRDFEDPTPGAFWTLESEAYSSGNFGILRWLSPSNTIPSLTITEEGRRVGVGVRPQEFVGQSQFQIRGENAAILLQNTFGPNPGGAYWTIESDAYREQSFGVVYWGSAGPQPHFIVTYPGNIGIGTRNPQAKLDVNGTTRTRVLQITGGADLAEHLSVTATKPGDEFKVEAGMVVSIDPSGNRKFKLSDEAYDRKRVGIICGGNGVQPGLVLRDEGNPVADGEQPIALTGQVWCHADALFGSITPGDLLTTSATPGHAMKVSEDAKARFAVLGQALTGLAEGRGWVQVLVRAQ